MPTLQVLPGPLPTFLAAVESEFLRAGIYVRMLAHLREETTAAADQISAVSAAEASAATAAASHGQTGAAATAGELLSSKSETVDMVHMTTPPGRMILQSAIGMNSDLSGVLWV